MSMTVRIAMVAAGAAALAGCAGRPDAPAASAGSPEAAAPASAELRDRDGRSRARANVEQAGDSLRVRVEATGLAPGAYGVHIHAVGRCDAPDFTTAGPHWNPTGAKHGKDNPQGMHKGDLPNLLVGSDGRGSFEYSVTNAAIGGRGPNVLFDGDGASVVVHASADDFRTDPSGNSGGRIACGVLDQA
jgi:superoxide dismutase, Cu-Zn family